MSAIDKADAEIQLLDEFGPDVTGLRFEIVEANDL